MILYSLSIRFRQRYPTRRFQGIQMKQLPDVEKLFQVNVMVYSLEKVEKDIDDDDDDDEEEETPDVTAVLVRRSLCHFGSTIYLNLYEDHFSYIKSMPRYSKSYQCSRCGATYTNGCNV